MADLQAVLMDNDALDDELQNRLLVGKAGILQTVMDGLGEYGKIGQNFLCLSTLLAELKVLFLLLLQSPALGGKLLAPVGEFLQAEDAGLVGIDQPPIGLIQARQACG
jgi:hypothetical protein